MITLLYYYIYTMKHSVKVLAFVAAALGLTVLSLQGTNAQSSQSNANVTLTINTGVITCNNGQFDLPAQSTSLTPITGVSVTWSNNTNSFVGWPSYWSCQDFQGLSSAPIQVVMSSGNRITNTDTNITTNNNIDPADTRMRADWVQGNCIANTVTTTATFTSIAAPVDLITKTVASNVCIYGAEVALEVDVPAQLAPGSYSGTITVTFPS